MPDQNGESTYRYVIVGMLVTHEPIPSLEGENDVIMDGMVLGIEEALEQVEKRKPDRLLKDANSILLTLKDL